MDRATKEAVVESFRETIREARSVVLTEFHGFTVDESVALRAKLRERGVTYRVIKNTLARRAVADTPMEVIGEHLRGPTAWAFSVEDPVAPAKGLVDYLSEAAVKDNLRIKAGYLQGKILDLAAVQALAKLPGRDELRAKLLSVFLARPTELVRVLAARPIEFLNVLKARSDSLDS